MLLRIESLQIVQRDRLYRLDGAENIFRPDVIRAIYQLAKPKLRYRVRIALKLSDLADRALFDEVKFFRVPTRLEQISSTRASVCG
jgi:hypothetical protein